MSVTLDKFQVLKNHDDNKALLEVEWELIANINNPMMQ